VLRSARSAAAVLLFLYRCAAPESHRRLAERLATTEKANGTFKQNAGGNGAPSCNRGRAGGRLRGGWVLKRVVGSGVPPVVDVQSGAFRQARGMAVLPDGSVVVEMMGDYAVMREQGGCVKRRKRLKQL